VAQSWLGGRNPQPIKSNQIESALGIETVDRLASAAGLNRAVTSSVLAALLPRMIGQLTPGGTIPSAGSLLSKVSSYLAPATATAALPSTRGRGWPAWLPWAAVLLLGLVGWLALRQPTGTLDPQLTVSNENGRITYSGRVRDEATRSTIVDALRAAVGASNVSGNLQIDRNVKRATWLPRIGDLVASLKRPGVELSLDGDTVNYGGWLSASERKTLDDSLRGIFGAQATIGTLADRAMEAVRTANDKAASALAALGTSGVAAPALVDAMNLAIINFPSGSAEIPSDSLNVIRTSAEAIKRAPAGTKIEIAGHTDNTGDAASNMRLSQARSDAVKNAFVAAGVNAGMLTTVGYGDNKPRATNETEYGRFQNRRIEYALR
jgi:outer membrane protein OmpA-like peptidoglycan-associated protein